MRRVLTTAALLLILCASCGEHEVTRMIGARCDDSDECDDHCLLPGDAYPGGLCTQMCDDDRDCPTGSVCAAEEGGVCLYDCAREVECGFLGAGWTCVERVGKPDGTVMVCRGG